MSAATTQHWNPEDYARHAGFVPQLGAPVIDLLGAAAGERVLDLGCGDGKLTQQLQERLTAVGGKVVGIDASAEMVAAARARGLDARLVDARSLEFDCEFDAVFSNAVLHWIDDHAVVIDGVWRALKPGGRFVAELGAEGNVASIVDALEGERVARGMPAARPWTFPRAEQLAAQLVARGFVVETISVFERPTPLPGDIRSWIDTLAQPFTAGVPAEEREAFMTAVLERLWPRLRGADGGWVADYLRLRFAALKPLYEGESRECPR